MEAAGGDTGLEGFCSGTVFGCCHCSHKAVSSVAAAVVSGWQPATFMAGRAKKGKEKAIRTPRWLATSGRFPAHPEAAVAVEVVVAASLGSGGNRIKRRPGNFASAWLGWRERRPGWGDR